MATCDPNALLASGACFQCLSPGQAAIAELQLLCDISESGGGGSGGVFQGSGAPVAPPANPDSPAIYTDLDDGVIYTWNVVTQAWI